MHTVIEYFYRDATNGKSDSIEAEFRGKITPDQKAIIMDSLVDQCFIPYNLGLPSPQTEYLAKYGYSDGIDHPWCELIGIYEMPGKPVHFDRGNIESVVQKFRDIEWDEATATAHIKAEVGERSEEEDFDLDSSDYPENEPEST